MSKMIQIRDVPDSLHRRLRAKAALAGMSLSDYLKQELERSANQLTPSEVLKRLASMPRVRLNESSAATIRRMRDAR
jgi:plasmid stability protein